MAASKKARLFKHILVPIDLSDRNRRALGTARELAEQHGARVTLLHVVQRIEGIQLGEMREFVRGLEARAVKFLQRVSRDFAACNVPVSGAVLLGAPAQEIVRYAQSKRADLIVIASHRIDGSRHTGRALGTTSYQVAVLCRCPVMLVK